MWVGPGQNTPDLYGWSWDSDYYLDNNKSLKNHDGVIKGPNQETKQGVWNYDCDDYNQWIGGVHVATSCSFDWFYPRFFVG